VWSPDGKAIAFLAREELADAWALRNGVDAASYARSLTAAAQRAHIRLSVASVGVAEGRSTLLRRVQAIMRTGSTKRVNRAAVVGLLVVLLAVAVALAAAQIREQSSSTRPGGRAPRAAAGLTSIGLGGGGGDEHRVEVSRSSETFDLGNVSYLTIETGLACVEHLYIGPGGPGVRVESVVYAERGDAATAAEARRLSLTSSPGPDKRARISVEGPHETALRIRLFVQAPREMEVALRLKSGGAYVKDRQAPIDISTDSGGVTVENIGGPVTARTGHGGISAQGVQGVIDVQTDYGGISLRDISGAVVARTGRGGIEADGLRGGATVQTGLGGITLRNVAGVTEADAGTGSVSLENVRGRAIRAASGSGTVRLTGVAGDKIAVRTGGGVTDVVLAEPFSGLDKERLAA